jgi:hypothetical protein
VHWRQPGCHAQAQWSEAKREVQSVHAETQRVVDETLDAEQSVQELRVHFSEALDKHSHVKTPKHLSDPPNPSALKQLPR